MLPITINYLPEQSALTIEQLTRAHTTKSIPNENLAGLAEDVLTTSPVMSAMKDVGLEKPFSPLLAGTGGP
jgi:hypothetical protein